MKIMPSAAIGATAALVAAFAVTPSASFASSAGVSEVVEFTYTTGDSLGSIVDQIESQLGPESAAEFLDQVAEQEDVDAGVGYAPLAEAAQDTGAIEGWEGQASLLAPEYSAMAVPAYAINGAVVAGTDRRTWRMRIVSEHVQCQALGVIGCEVTDRRTTQITIDPGNLGSRFQFQQSTFPNAGRIDEPTLTLRVYRNGSLNGSRLVQEVGIGYTSLTLAHTTALRSNGFAFTVTGSVISNGQLRSLTPWRTGDGGCSTATQPICRFS